MGMVLGKITVEMPKHEVLHTGAGYEVRKYPPCVAAEVTYDPAEMKGDRDGGFTVLANYIGALGRPQNTRPEKIDMTAPVITSGEPEPVAMTAPVITAEEGGQGKGQMTMQFLLPSKYSKVEEAPRPTDERVVLRQVGERKYGVVRFSGLTGDKVVKERAEWLKAALEKDGFTVKGPFVLARYNPPFTLPPLRTNEVMIPVE
uniref:SOUL heme-binding protein n=1 Tax=Oryza punctata TaxID=4537 RepID=A0A0E0JR41_ORYPU